MSTSSGNIGSSRGRSDSSASSSNRNGRWELDKRLCSVLCHRSGPPLACTFHGEDPWKLDYLEKKSNFVASEAYDNILQLTVEKWQGDGTRKDTALTANLTKSIDEDNGNATFPLEAKTEEAVCDMQHNI
jgi:hypothetical protein